MSSNSTERPAAAPPSAAPVASPCVRNCCLDERDICLGCGRSLAEILEWGGASDSRREQICANGLARRQARNLP